MAEDIFTNLAQEEPDRENEIGIDDIDLKEKSASEQEATSPNDSELDTILKRLFPSFDDVDIERISKVIMLGRVFPDNFSTKVYLIVTNLALKHCDDPKFDVISTMMIIEGLAQIGLEGKGRVEAVIVSGKTKEQAEMEQKTVGNF